MAIETLNKVTQIIAPPIYAYHEIVHNQFVVNDFKSRGVVFVESIADVPEGATLVYSAHGVSPQVRKDAADRKLRTIDATCPLVAKVHMEALRFAKEGFQIIYIGHKGHQEVVGTMGEVPHSMHLVETVSDVDALHFAPGTRLAYLTQTTLSLDDTRNIIKKLVERFPQIVGPKKDDICYATQNRQDAVKRLSQDADLVLVIGSSNSSNSQRLVEVARGRGIAAHLIADVRDIRTEWFQTATKVLITSGASAPEPLVQELVAFLQETFLASVKTEAQTPEGVTFSLPKELLQIVQTTSV